MKLSEYKLINAEFDKVTRYIHLKGIDNLTSSEVCQEIGALRLYIYRLFKEGGDINVQ